MPATSAIVCTRNRPESLVRAIKSLLVPVDDAIELIVMDQSDGTDTERALRSECADPRLVYVRTLTRGKGDALNHGLQLAKSDRVVLTDDDCEAPAGWVSRMGSELAAHAD